MPNLDTCRECGQLVDRLVNPRSCWSCGAVFAESFYDRAARLLGGA